MDICPRKFNTTRSRMPQLLTPHDIYVKGMSYSNFVGIGEFGKLGRKKSRLAMPWTPIE